MARHDEPVYLSEPSAFGDLFEAVPTALYLLDAEGCFRACNRAFAILLGRPRADVVGCHFVDCCGEAAERERLAHEGGLQIGKTQSYELPIIDLANRKRVLHISVARLTHLGEQCTIGSVVDISNQKRIEVALRERERDLRTTLDSIGDGVITTDIDGRVRRMNPEAERLTGWTLEEARGLDSAVVLRLRSESGIGELLDPVRIILERKRAVAFPDLLVMQSRDGSEHRIADRGAPMFDNQGTLTGAVLVLRDVTEQNRMRAELQHAQRLDVVGQLTGGVVHDMNNMLSCVLGAAELMIERLEDDESREYAKIIVDTVDRASDLTGKLLRFSRKHEYGDHQQQVDMHAVIREIMAIIERSFDPRIKLDLRFAATRANVQGIATELQSALLNLAVNARDAMPDGGHLSFATADWLIDEATAATTRLAEGPALCLEIHDTGTGIPESVLPHIFDAFYTTKPSGQGSGLGLSAVATAVREHGGHITVDSMPGEGTCFRILLPVIDVGQRERRRTSTVHHGSGCILLVDDEPVVRSTLGSMLRELGYEVLEAVDGQQAVATYHAHGDSIDLVLMDVIMPELDGLGAFRAIRAYDTEAQVVLCSGCAGLRSLDRLFDEGLLAFLSKPVGRAALSRSLAEFLPPRN